MTRYAKRRDANEGPIVAAARAIGLKVFYTSDLGDLIVQHGDRTELWEVKNRDGKNRLTDAQVRLRAAGLKAHTIYEVNDVLDARKRFIR